MQDGGKIRCILFLSTPSLRRATYFCCASIICRLFLSTPSLRRATREPQSTPYNHKISIHALLAEGD